MKIVPADFIRGNIAWENDFHINNDGIKLVWIIFACAL